MCVVVCVRARARFSASLHADQFLQLAGMAGLRVQALMAQSEIDNAWQKNARGEQDERP